MPPNDLQSVMDHFGLPKHTFDFSIEAKAGELWKVNATYGPDDGKGGVIWDGNSETWRLLSETYMLVPRDLFNTLPTNFRIDVAKRQGVWPPDAFTAVEMQEHDAAESLHKENAEVTAERLLHRAIVSERWAASIVALSLLLSAIWYWATRR